MEYIYTQKKIVGDVVFSIQNKNILRITNAITYDDSGYDTFFSHKDMRLNHNKKIVDVKRITVNVSQKPIEITVIADNETKIIKIDMDETGHIEIAY